MKIIQEVRRHWGDTEHRLVAERDDGTRVESDWVSDTDPAFLSDAAIAHGHVVEENPHGPGWIVFTDYHPEMPSLSRYEPCIADLVVSDLGVVEDNVGNNGDDEEDADNDIKTD